MCAALAFAHVTNEEGRRRSRSRRSDNRERQTAEPVARTAEEEDAIKKEAEANLERDREREKTRIGIESRIQQLFSTSDIDGFKSLVKVYRDVAEPYFKVYSAIQQKIPNTPSGYTDRELLHIATYTGAGEVDTGSSMLREVARTISEGWLPVYRKSSTLANWDVSLSIESKITEDTVEYEARLSGKRNLYTNRLVTIRSSTTAGGTVFHTQTGADSAPLEYCLEEMSGLLNHIASIFQFRFGSSIGAGYETQCRRLEVMHIMFSTDDTQGQSERGDNSVFF